MQFQLRSHHYQASKLDAFAQQDVAVALAPALTSLVSVCNELKNGADKHTFLDVVLPQLGTALSHLGRENRKTINHLCLAGVSRQQGTLWTPIYDLSNRVMLFDDINGLDLIKIVGYVIKESLGDFFPAAPENPDILASSAESAPSPA